MTDFDDIRPYHDDEVRPALDRILNDPELADAVAKLKFPHLAGPLGFILRPIVKNVMKRQLAAVDSVDKFQQVVEKYMRHMIETTTTRLTSSGLDQLDPNGGYLFISNHRDIAMDPAFVNWSIYHAGFQTLRIAIGDNLLTKPYVSDLMRLNKSFIVNRSAKAPREKLKAAKKLSAYIHHSLTEDKANIWIAQREGRAKDGNDLTNTAVIGMLMLNRPKAQDFSEYVRSLKIVPVSISYEQDPCDAAKAHELFAQRTTGRYEKGDQEDVQSIAKGIAGQKGHVHVAFGSALSGEYADTDAVAAEIDRQIWAQYVLHASNCFAFDAEGEEARSLPYSDKNVPFEPGNVREERAAFDLRVGSVPSEYRDIVLEMYANPVRNKLKARP
ncbi:1-acyl-sn-glycerol-3-phosphate acyltransferase [Gilvimarinus sp. SDUM040013]|uniref:1-acyl-sn-glycerol-3-phosphate acyltransferase n=1 Tax=Gilvimarinus gilvus TaxID=3058038 RepID=A0ABU4RSF8_9GAMM|nr:1-acyl-sn-glycerol-3-phosphate acyltransferase [Gilvimarinus sp. SDUM040013]MDO3388285.1 1-acyl-sn-glycerol-3-phosphate acyltransferase [Gilvimarinus sp. SDUM040013]MDX6847835.1 1-acyl-sn-glycerol-3-phosphate acyltransferase [Gilvimarinus sp. SDUM040013]